MRIFFLAAGSVFLADRISKILAVQALESLSTRAVWPGVFHLTLVRNSGVAFGWFKNSGLFFTLLSLVSAAALFVYVSRLSKSSMDRVTRARLWAWSAVAGGALGNAYDRIRFGAVIDFLDFRVWPVFNLADSAIVCGAAVVAFIVFFHKDPPK